MKKKIGNEKINNLQIEAKSSLIEVGLLLCLVEMLADRRSKTGACHQLVPFGWRAMETSSIEAYVNGNTTIKQDEDVVRSDFTSSFIFTCSQTEGRDHSFQWLCSLS